MPPSPHSHAATRSSFCSQSLSRPNKSIDCECPEPKPVPTSAPTMWCPDDCVCCTDEPSPAPQPLIAKDNPTTEGGVDPSFILDPSESVDSDGRRRLQPGVCNPSGDCNCPTISACPASSTGSALNGCVIEDPYGTNNVGPLPLAGAPISLLDNLGNTIFTSVTDADGNYTFCGVPAGTFGILNVPLPGLIAFEDFGGSPTDSFGKVVAP